MQAQQRGRLVIGSFGLLHFRLIVFSHIFVFVMFQSPPRQAGGSRVSELMKSRVHFSSITEDWKTPKSIYDLLDKEFHFAYPYDPGYWLEHWEESGISDEPDIGGYDTE